VDIRLFLFPCLAGATGSLGELGSARACFAPVRAVWISHFGFATPFLISIPLAFGWASSRSSAVISVGCLPPPLPDG
jgi:hypothetical protein